MFRRAVLERDRWRCKRCRRAGRLEIDHIIPVHLRPDLELSFANAQTLCASCHLRKTAAERGTPERDAWRALVEWMINAPTIGQDGRGTLEED